MSFELDRIAQLANLSLNEDEKVAVVQKMEGILHFVETITSLDLGEKEASVSSYEFPTVFREDTPEKSIGQKELIANTPKIDNSSIIVPQVIQK